MASASKTSSLGAASTNQPRGRVGRNAAERRDVLGELGSKVLRLLAESNLAAVEQVLDDPSNKAKTTKAFYHSVMNACTKRNSNMKSVWWIADQMEKRGLKANIVTFNCMVGSCMKEQKFEMARQLWDKMFKSGLKPNRITYNIMINAAAKSGYPSDAEEWLARMVQDGIKPCTVSYTAVIHAFAKLGNTDSVEDWFARMEEAGEAPDAVVFNSVINSCAKAGQVGKAEKWVRRMLEAGFRPDDKTYNCLTHACGRSKDPEVTGLWSANMLSTGVGKDAMTFSTLIASSAKAGKIDIACEWLGEMENHGFEPNRTCYNCILRACSLQGDVKTAMHFWILLNSKTQQGPNTESYNCMIGTFLQAGEPHLAVEWSQRMLKAGQQPDSVTMSMFQNLAPDDLSAEGSNITASICKLLHAGAFEKVKICLEHMKRLKFVVSDELIEKIILECLSIPPGGGASRSTTSMSSDFQDLQSEASTTMPERPFQESSAQSLMQFLLPNVAVQQLSGGTVILSF
jgi:pentatricopeptide repeat protein